MPISNFKFKYFPLKYNLKQLFTQEKEIYNDHINSIYFNRWINRQKKSPFKYSNDEILEAVHDPVIIHLYQEKVQSGNANKKYTIQWIKYAKMTGYYNEIKKKYPSPFLKYEKFIR